MAPPLPPAFSASLPLPAPAAALRRDDTPRRAPIGRSHRGGSLSRVAALRSVAIPIATCLSIRTAAMTRHGVHQSAAAAGRAVGRDLRTRAAGAPTPPPSCRPQHTACSAPFVLPTTTLPAPSTPHAQPPSPTAPLPAPAHPTIAPPPPSCRHTACTAALLPASSTPHAQHRFCPRAVFFCPARARPDPAGAVDCGGRRVHQRPVRPAQHGL